MGLIETRKMIVAGDLVMWHDYRAGHCANQAGYSTTVFDGGVNGSQGRFRTGHGYETSHDFAAVPASLGFIRVGDNAAFYPPVGGMCLIASYVQSASAVVAQVIGQGAGRGADDSWRLVRTNAGIEFSTADGVASSTFSYALPAVRGQVETVLVRYTGGTGPNNCTITVLSPTPSSSTGTIDRVPQDSSLAVSVGCLSDSTDYPFMGTIRYCAYIRGAQTAAALQAVANEMEAISWPDAIAVQDISGSAAARAVQYTSRFGVDQSIANEGVVGSQLSNSQWIFGDADKLNAGTWLLRPYHAQHAAAGGSADIQKEIYCVTDGCLRLPYERFSLGTTQALAAYGTWDFWLFYGSAHNVQTFVAHIVTTDGVNLFDDGYAVMFEGSGLSGQIGLYRMDQEAIGNVVVESGANAVPKGASVRVRVTRTVGNVWKLFYDAGAGWVYVGTGTDGSYATSDGLFLNYAGGDAILLGNHRSERAILKWRGVVDPR